MIKTILDYLKSDTILTTLLLHDAKYPKITAYFPFNKENYPYIVVNNTPDQNELAVDRFRCEVRIVTDNELTLETIIERVMYLMHFRNRKSIQINNDTIYHSKHTGSGFLFDEENHVFEQVLFFTLKTKVKE